jgi:hypothetical protein
LGKKAARNQSGKKRPKAATNLPQFAAFCHWRFAAFCRSRFSALQLGKPASSQAVDFPPFSGSFLEFTARPRRWGDPPAAMAACFTF